MVIRTLLISKYALIVPFALIAGLVFWYSVRNTEIPEGVEIAPVERGEVIEVISETGFVLPTNTVNLGFERGGRVVEVLVEKGTRVEEGDVLMRLEQTRELSDVTTARARLDAEKARLDELLKGADPNSLAVTQSTIAAAEVALQNAKRNLEEVETQQAQLVKNALRTLRSSDIQAYLVSSTNVNSSFSYDPPTITGLYDFEEEGTYYVSLYSSDSPSGSSFRLSGLEEDTRAVPIFHPTMLGTRGLYIEFPEDFAGNTKWEIPIPNIRSNNYVTNVNAYNAVRNAHDVAVSGAESAVHAAEAALRQAESQYTQIFEPARAERVRAQQALVTQMQAAVDVAQIAYEDSVIRAPFTGIITSLEVERGEIVPPASSVATIISEGTVEVAVNVSESDIRELSVGDTATVVLTAYDDMIFDATVTDIAPQAILVDGVRVFEVVLQFLNPHELIRPGLSADVEILTAERGGVVLVPSRAVIERDGGRYVRVYTENHFEYMPVTVGLRGSNGFTEILSGLTEGQDIVTFVTGEVLKEFDSK